MKKLISLLLIAALCLGLVACGGGEQKDDPAKALVGTWKSADGKQMTFNSDGTCDLLGPNGHELQGTWAYLSDSGEFELKEMTFGRRTISVKVADDGTQSITWYDVEYTKAG